MEKLIIEAALNELISKQQNRNVPYGPDEVARDTKDCVDAGLSFLHFHAREQTFGEMEWNKARLYKEGILRMRALGVPPELPWYPTYLTLDPFYQEHVVDLAEDPEVRLQIAAIDMGSDNINDYDASTKTFTSPDQTKAWSHDFHEQFFRLCREQKQRPYLGVYEPGALRAIAQYLDLCDPLRELMLRSSRAAKTLDRLFSVSIALCCMPARTSISRTASAQPGTLPGQPSTSGHASAMSTTSPQS